MNDSFFRFVVDLIRAAYHMVREAYYALALRHVGDHHPDAFLITRRMLNSRLVVDDFIRQRLG